MKFFFPPALSILLLAAGCGSADDGFRFEGVYSAGHSRFLLRVVSGGYAEADGKGQSRAVAQVCPADATEGRPVRMTFTAAGDGEVTLECPELGPVAVEWNARTQEGVLRGLLTSSGYRQIDAAELGACIAAINRSLVSTRTGAKGTSRDAIRVISEDLTQGREIDHESLPEEWIDPSEPPGCDPERR